MIHSTTSFSPVPCAYPPLPVQNSIVDQPKVCLITDKKISEKTSLCLCIEKIVNCFKRIFEWIAKNIFCCSSSSSIKAVPTPPSQAISDKTLSGSPQYAPKHSVPSPTLGQRTIVLSPAPVDSVSAVSTPVTLKSIEQALIAKYSSERPIRSFEHDPFEHDLQLELNELSLKHPDFSFDVSKFVKSTERQLQAHYATQTNRPRISIGASFSGITHTDGYQSPPEMTLRDFDVSFAPQTHHSAITDDFRLSGLIITPETLIEDPDLGFHPQMAENDLDLQFSSGSDASAIQAMVIEFLSEKFSGNLEAFMNGMVLAAGSSPYSFGFTDHSQKLLEAPANPSPIHETHSQKTSVRGMPKWTTFEFHLTLLNFLPKSLEETFNEPQTSPFWQFDIAKNAFEQIEDPAEKYEYFTKFVTIVLTFVDKKLREKPVINLENVDEATQTAQNKVEKILPYISKCEELSKDTIEKLTLDESQQANLPSKYYFYAYAKAFNVLNKLLLESPSGKYGWYFLLIKTHLTSTLIRLSIYGNKNFDRVSIPKFLM